MAEVTMSLYQALAKKKVLESQVNSFSIYRLCGIKKKANDTVTSDNLTTEEAKKSYQSGKDRTIALLDNLITLKAAINEANAKTTVIINDKEYSIANAISLYRSLDEQEKLYSRMLVNINKCKEDVEKTNSRYLSPEKISEYVSRVLGDSKKDQTLIDSTTNAYKAQYEVELYDPLDTEKLATEKLQEIADFREQFHYALTEVNCKTMITVNFAD